MDEQFTIAPLPSHLRQLVLHAGPHAALVDGADAVVVPDGLIRDF
jgi:hypothetical protein